MIDLASDFKLTSWKGITNYECLSCPWKGLGLDNAMKHKIDSHIVQPESSFIPAEIDSGSTKTENVVKEKEKEA